MFRLQPDLLVEKGAQAWVLDTKWKTLDGGDRANKYGLSQGDFYQLFAYGNKYLGGKGELALIYPRTRRFDRPLQPFDFSPELRLWALPFDLDADTLLVDDEMQLTQCIKAAESAVVLDQIGIPG
tara:strand:- start:288 stop:662 length:375 start_codon:yes stop_codon:yes gene_type:complete